ncbi:phosphoserine phosphatase SerB [Thiobacter aerophilum]|uniref:Phosphoserine phosphatase n=1 Tax=Thiobacter aerophilum TaxID=3121275 RepID=A0ABV0EET8_9BURK
MNLVIQGLDVKTPDLKTLARLTQANGIEQVRPNVFRLVHSTPHPDVPRLCEGAQLDYGYVPEGQRLDQLGLVVMDMDSTLITIECIDEIADMLGIKPQVAAITASAMRGEMEFAESLTRRVALLAGLEEIALQRVYDERLKLSPGAERLLAVLKAHGIKTLLVSGGFTFFTQRLKTRLGLDYAVANTVEIVDGKLTGKVLGKIIDAQGKADWLNRVRTELELGREQVLAIGDGANDLKMLAEAGISVAYHAKPVVREKTSYAINYVGLDGVLEFFEY